MEKSSNTNSNTNFAIYCHFFLDSQKGVIKTNKVILENSNVHVIELKEKISKLLSKDSTSSPFKIISLKKTINSETLLDTVKVSQFFEHKDDIFCQVELNIQPVMKTNLPLEDDILRFKSLTNYSFWEVNKQVVKVRVPLKGSEQLPKENIKSSFTESSLEVKVFNLGGVNYVFGVPRLDAKIVPEKSEASIDKEGNIIIRLRKAKEEDHWSYLYKQKYVGEN